MVREAELTRILVTPGATWSRVTIVPLTGSTNADLVAAARTGAPEGTVLIAEHQDAGRGRMGRSWQTPRGTALTMSVLLRPRGVAAARLGWLPLLTGVAVVGACAALPGIEAALKWPNDLLVRRVSAAPAGRGSGWGKCGGILAEAVDGEAIVVGIGINVRQREAQLPPPPDPQAYPATSLLLAGARVGRERLAAAVLRALDDWYARWCRAAGDPDSCGLRTAYEQRCATLGRVVTASLPGGASLSGTANAIDRDGRLVVVVGTAEHRLSAGDVHHLRPAAGVDDPPVQGRVPVAPPR